MSMAMGKKGSMSDINITPYIDILLVLLIIFITITPVDQLDLEVKVPQNAPESANNAIDPSVIVVSTNEALNLEINKESITLARLGAKLQEIYSARANKNMFISATLKTSYSDVVKIIDIAKGAGVGDIGLLDTSAMH